MTTTAIRMPAPVLPGRRIEISSPDLPEGGTVEVIILVPGATEERASGRAPMLEIAASVLPGPRPYATWEEYDRARGEDKGSWDA